MVATRAKMTAEPVPLASLDGASDMGNQATDLTRQRKRQRLSSDANGVLQHSALLSESIDHALRSQTATSPRAKRQRQKGNQEQPDAPQETQHDLPEFDFDAAGASLADFDASADAIPEMPSDSDLAAIGITSAGYNPPTHLEHPVPAAPSASLQIRLLSLPSLDNFAIQLLKLIAEMPITDILQIASTPHALSNTAYHTLLDLFHRTKAIYGPDAGQLQAEELGLTDPEHVQICKRANLTTFVSKVVGPHDATLLQLDRDFRYIFVEAGQSLSASLCEIWLELKMQAYVAALPDPERSQDDLLDMLFPADLESSLQSYKQKPLTQVERDFVQRVPGRRRTLKAQTVAQVKGQYKPFALTTLVAGYVSKNLPTLLSNKPSNTLKKTTQSTAVLSKSQRVPSNATAGQLSISYSSPGISTQGDDIAGKAQRAAQIAMGDYDSAGTSTNVAKPSARSTQKTTPNISNGTKQPELHFHYENQLHPNVPGPQMSMFQGTAYPGEWHNGAPTDANFVPFPTQSAPTQVLYERARQAALAKAGPSARKSSSPGQRRPWTLEEENALMAGLDRVKGPHWSQILAMFGAGGTISEVLKDRNQVQLKDKARNLKLFFLKNNHEVPYYLQFVTGELRTRAPAQAARNEAKGKSISEEDRAHVEGILALASGSQMNGETGSSSLDQQLDTTAAHNGSDSHPQHTDPHSADFLDPSLDNLARHGSNGAENDDNNNIAAAAAAAAAAATAPEAPRQRTAIKNYAQSDQHQRAQQARQNRFQFMNFADLAARAGNAAAAAANTANNNAS